MAPSVAILNGCGTARPGAANFIRQLNLHGIQAAVATVTEVDGTTAGVFMDCFAGAIEQTRISGADTIALSAAYGEAVQCAYEKREARALWYSLIGNGSLKICVPKSSN